MHINIDIDLKKVPCHILSVDVEDVVGSHIVDFEGELYKRVIDENGKIYEVLDAKDRAHDTKTVLEKTIKDLDDKKGCNLKGNIIVNKIDGNFHISSHAYGEAVMNLYAQRRMLDFTHQINFLSFGEQENISKIGQIINGYNMHPLDKFGESSHPKDLGGHFHNTFTVYHLDITPAKYIISEEESYEASEYTYSTQTINTHGMPAIYVKYNLSPLVIAYNVTLTPFLVFLVRVWAVIGGVYTVASVFDTLFYPREKKKKEEVHDEDIKYSPTDYTIE